MAEYPLPYSIRQERSPMNRLSISTTHMLFTRVLRNSALLLAMFVIIFAACNPEAELPHEPSIDDWRLGNFELELNGQRLEGNLASTTTNVDDQHDLEANASFHFTAHSADMYELRRLLFTAKRKVGHYMIDTIRPDAVAPVEWDYNQALYHHSLEYGHAGGVFYIPILEDTIADFLALDSIVGGMYYGRFQVSFVSLADTREEIPSAPDTVIIRNGRFAVREYFGE